MLVEKSQLYLDFNMEFHDRYPEMLAMKYEDVVDNQLEPIEKYIGFFLNGNSLVDAQYENVIRTKSYGDWRNWFLPEDVEFFKPIFKNYMERYGYRQDWDLNLSPRILPAHCSEYAEKITAEFFSKKDFRTALTYGNHG